MTTRVLVADGDPEARQVLAGVLADWGAEVVEAATAADGYDRFLELGAALAFIDVLLPSQGGTALLRRLRSLRGGRELPVLMTSALSLGADLRREAVGSLGALDVLKKPFHLPQLRERIARALADGPAGAAEEGLPFAPGSVVDRGSFAATDPAVVFRDLLAQRATGCLSLRQGRTKKAVFLQDGAVLFVLSNQLGETLGRSLLARGVIAEETYRSALEAMRTEGRKMGELLVAAGALAPAAAAEAIRENILAKALEVFSWREGEFQLAPFQKPPAPLPGAPFELARILFQGVCERLPYERIGGALAAHSGWGLTARGDLSALAGSLPLEKADLQLLRLLGGVRGKTLGEVLRGVAGEREVRLLYYLLLQGLLGLVGSGLPRGEELPGGDRERVRRARNRLAATRNRNHFQILEVATSATDEKVRDAYLQRAREVHPDVLGPQDPEELRRLYGELFQAVHGAYEALKTETLRRDYRAFLEEGSRSAATDGARVLEAETLFQEGRALLARRQWDGAAAALRRALDLIPGEGEYALQLGIARTRQAASGKPGLLADAEALFRQARSALPGSPEPCYRLGRLALLKGEGEVATQHFHAALARDPRHPEALRELRLLQARGTAKGSLAGDLPGRKA